MTGELNASGVLIEDAALRVCASDDAGDYYCGHVNYALHTAVASEVTKDAAGEALIGFLHVPPDDATKNRQEDCAGNGSRHASLGRVVAAAARGFLAAFESDPQSVAPMRLLLTGFGPFCDVVSNPTGTFVNDMRGVADAVRAVTGVVPELSPTCVRTRRLDVFPRELVVDDSTLDIANDSGLISLVRTLEPHAVLCLGVSRDSAFQVETTADDRGLVHGNSGWRHEAGTSQRHRLPASGALTRAVVSGWTLLKSSGPRA